MNRLLAAIDTATPYTGKIAWKAPWQDHRILIMGPRRSGKATIQNYLFLDTSVSTIVTYGLNMKDVAFRDITRNHLCGDRWYNQVWHESNYRREAVGVIYVMDSSRYGSGAEHELNIGHARRALWEVFERHPFLLKQATLLVFANKQDGLGAMSVPEVKEALDLERAGAEDLRWHVEGSVATTGEGLLEGMAWMATQWKHARR